MEQATLASLHSTSYHFPVEVNIYIASFIKKLHKFGKSVLNIKYRVRPSCVSSYDV